MGTHNGKHPTVWMRSIKWHTYEGKPQDVGQVYLAHEDIVETIEALKFAVRDVPPPRAVRAPAPDVAPPAPVAEPVSDAAPVPDLEPAPAPTESVTPAPSGRRRRT